MSVAAEHRVDRGRDLPKGMGVVLARQRTGFWGRLGGGPAAPDFGATEIPRRIYTFEPWLGCLWGTSCRFCYVPNLSQRFYPGGPQSDWFTKWGQWLLPKPDISARLEHALLDGRGNTRASIRGACVFMSAKTDPFLPVPELLKTSAANLDVFAKADVLLMCQTRSIKTVEDPELFQRIVGMAAVGKVGVSFSISTDLKEQQKRFEVGGALPEQRLQAMSRLKEAGVFVSAAVCPVLPHSGAFASRLQAAANHASVQPLRDVGFGATTPRAVLQQARRGPVSHENLSRDLVGQFDDPSFSWGVGNKGFVGAFLAAQQFYNVGDLQHQLAFPVGSNVEAR